MPAATPVTLPLADPTVATAGADDVHVPPAIVFVNVVDDPVQVLNVPAIADGVVFTVKVVAE